MSDIIIGIDEVGRGALVGNVVTAAVYFPPTTPKQIIALCQDSKRLNPPKRQHIYELLIQHTIYSIGEATPREIDTFNILGATLLAMQRAFYNLHLPVTDYRVYVDGNICPNIPKCECVIRGDTLIAQISAASIIAKVTRDKQMITLHTLYPQYGFISHKGYPTQAHHQALKRYGVLAAHRKSYAPVQKSIYTQTDKNCCTPKTINNQ